MRQHLFAQRAEVVGVAEHVAHLHGQVFEHAGKHLGLVQHAVLQLRKGLALELRQRGIQAAAQRRLGIRAKVVVVAQVDGIDQQPLLNVRRF